MGAQVIKCKGCGAIFAACMEPYCYTERDWLREMRKYALRGDTVEIVERGEARLGTCTCKKKSANPAQPTLFEHA